MDSYNWLITGLDVYPREERRDFFEALCRHDYLWLDSAALREIFQADGFCTLWCVLSGFKKDVLPEAVLAYPLPYADGNPGFWIDDPTLQNPLAELEIVAFDGCQSFILSRNGEHAARFKDAFKGAYDLIADNRAVNGMIRRIESVIWAMDLGWDERKRDCLKWKVYHALFKGQALQPTDDEIQTSLLEDHCSSCRWPICREKHTNAQMDLKG